MPTKRRLVIHLGEHKTCSTAIQQVLVSGRVQAPGGMVFPTGRAGLSHHNNLARALRRRKTDEAEIKAQFAKVAAAIDASDAQTAILSGEGFERVAAPRMAEALAQYLPDLAEEARLIVYLRPHGARILSSFAEKMKQGLFSGDLAAFHAEQLAEGDYLYAPRMAAWRKAFGDRLTVRPMLRTELKGGDVVADFLDWVFPGGDVTFPELPLVNEKLSVEDLAVLRAVQEPLLDMPGPSVSPREPTRALGWRVARMLAARPEAGATPVALDRALVAQIQAAYAEDAATVDRDFLGGPALVPALKALTETAVETPQSFALEDNLSPEAARMARAWIRIITQLYRHKPQNWRPHFQANPLRLPGGGGGAAKAKDKNQAS